MPRALDHVVWPARDLKPLVDLFFRLGFQVGRRNRHPWGTINHIIQFKSSFIELLGFSDDYVPVVDDDPAFPFAGFCENALRIQAVGPAMLVLHSDDAAADAKALQGMGLGSSRMLPFSRTALGPDGEDKTVSFTIAFADQPSAPKFGVFLCQQHRPENFWNVAAQSHPNGATGVDAITIAGLEAEGQAALVRIVDAPSSSAAEIGLENRCRLVIEPSPDAARITGLVFTVADTAKVEAQLAASNVPFRNDGNRLLCDTKRECGADLVFTTSL